MGRRRADRQIGGLEDERIGSRKTEQHTNTAEGSAGRYDSPRLPCRRRRERSDLASVT